MKDTKLAKLTHPIRKEFTWTRVRLKHFQGEDFVKSQWQQQTSNHLFLIYRFLIAIIFTTIVILTILKLYMHGRYFIYLTHWGLLLCMITNIYGALLVALWHWRPNKNETNFINEADHEETTLIPWSLKIYWALHMTALNVALVITFIYWAFLYGLQKTAEVEHPSNDEYKSGYLNYLEHALNSILMLIDLMIVAFPIRILHIIYPMIFALSYVLFTVIYYLAGGVDEYGNPWIYPILNWTRPDIAFGTIFGCFGLLVFFGFFTFLLYKLRSFIYRKFDKKSEIPS